MTNQKICSNCGCQLEDNMKCCPNCGAPVNNEVINREKTEEEPFPPEEIDMLSDQGTNSSNPYISKKFIIIFVSILAVVLVALFWGRIQNKDPVQQAIDNQSQKSSFVQNSYPSNVEDGLGTNGARFTFTLAKFTEKLNADNPEWDNSFADTVDYKPIANGDWVQGEDSQVSDVACNRYVYTYPSTLSTPVWIYADVDKASSKMMGITLLTDYDHATSSDGNWFKGYLQRVAMIVNQGLDSSETKQLLDKTGLADIQQIYTNASVTYGVYEQNILYTSRIESNMLVVSLLPVSGEVAQNHGWKDGNPLSNK